MKRTLAQNLRRPAVLPARMTRVLLTAAAWLLLSSFSAAFLSRPVAFCARPSLCLPVSKEPITISSDNSLLVNIGDSRRRSVPSSPTYVKKRTTSPYLHPPTYQQNTTRPDDIPICRVVTRSDTKLPMSCLTNVTRSNNHSVSTSLLMTNLDSIYHAIAHEETRQLQYMQQQQQHSTSAYDAVEEKKLVSLTRAVLEDAGFQRLSRRDIDLCDALNAGYLLRLSLLPDTKNLDPNLFENFYPELVNKNGKLLDDDGEELLFDGRVLVYWRGYSEEVSQGRLLLPKLDYLQASLVQRSAAWLKQRLNVAERWLIMRMTDRYQRTVGGARSALISLVGKLPRGALADAVRLRVYNNTLGTRQAKGAVSSRGRLFTLSRYGGSKLRFIGSPDPSNALDPFVVCTDVVNCLGSNKVGGSKQMWEADDTELSHLVNSGGLTCQYDDDDIFGDDEKTNEQADNSRPSMQLLKRVSLGSLIDLFTRDGRKMLFRTLLSKSKLVEPTYKEVVVVWRPLPKKDVSEPVLKLPLWLYDIADMFDLDGLPPKPLKPEPVTPSNLEIRSFSDVPMANLPAVLPKTKLVFRPADALVFDSITLLSLGLVVGSFKFDNPRLDLLALVSGSLWIIRTFLRYSNKLARYDLLVKTFLTTKITHRNMGALKYIATEAGSQRALRATLFHTLLSRTLSNGNIQEPVERNELIRQGALSLDQVSSGGKHLFSESDAAICDLEDLGLIRTTANGRHIVVREPNSVMASLKKYWCDLFGRKSVLRTTFARR